MNIKVIFSQMGMILGDFVNENEDDYEIENPVLVVTQREGASLVPFLALMQENRAKIRKSSSVFMQSFTPVTEIINSYNQLYGSGIVQISKNIKV